MAKKKKVTVDIPALIGFTKLMEKHPEHAKDMVIARFTNLLAVTQYRAKTSTDAGQKPRVRAEFWIYAVKIGDRVNRSMIYRLTQPIDSLAKRFGQKISWKKGELQVAEYNGTDYIVKSGVVRNVLAYVPQPGANTFGIHSDYNQAFTHLKKAGISLKDARKLFEE